MCLNPVLVENSSELHILIFDICPRERPLSGDIVSAADISSTGIDEINFLSIISIQRYFDIYSSSMIHATAPGRGYS
jgi:hypothetical protein